MATVTGARGTTLISSAQRKIDMAGPIMLLQPDETPFTTFLQNLSKRPTGNPQFKAMSDKLEPRFDAINNGAGYNTSAPSVVVDNGAYFAEHDLVLNTRTGEMVRVTAVSTNTLTVVRAVGSTAAAMNDNDELSIIASAQPEGDTSKPARSSNPSSVQNYTQIFTDPWELTNTAYASENQVNPHDWDLQAKKKGIEHKRSINRAFWFGKASEDTSGSQARRTTGGFFSFATSNSTDAGGTLSETEWNTAMRGAFRYGAKKKLAFAAPLAVSVLNTFPAGKVQITDQNNKQYGIDVTTFTSPFGVVRLVTEWEFEGAVYGGYIAIVDPDNVHYRYLRNDKENRDSHIEANIQAPDADTKKNQWKSEVGLQVDLPETHAIITGITG